MKTRFVVEIRLFIVWVTVKCIPLHYAKFPNKEWTRHKFLKDEFSKGQMQPKIIIKIIKSLDKITIKYLEQVCPKQAHELLSWLLSWNTILPRLILSSWSVICLVRSISQHWIAKKIDSFWRIRFRRYWQYISQYNVYNFKWCIIQLANIFALRSATGTHPHFSIKEILNLGQQWSWSSKFSTPASFKMSKILNFFNPFAKYSPFTSLKRVWLQLTVIHCSTRSRASFFYTKMLVSRVCIFLEDKMSILDCSHRKKLPTSS